MLCPGQVYRWTMTVNDIDAAPSLATLVITKPDGTEVTPVLDPPTQAGRNYTYTYDYPLPCPGLFRFTGSTQGPGSAPLPDYINVRDFLSIVSMAEVKKHLNKSSYDDEELGGFMMAATELVENKVGICVPREFTEQVDEGRHRLLVAHRPLLSVTSVTSVWAGGPSWPTDQLRWDGEAGIIWQYTAYPFWWGPWTIVMRSGRPVMREPWVHAAKEQVRHLWETQRGGQPPALLQGEEEFTTTTGFTFSVPRRVLELLEEDMVPAS